jgi:cell division septum initiation protein DivIVA
MNSDEKIIKMLEELQAGQEQQGKDIASLKTGQE